MVIRFAAFPVGLIPAVRGSRRIETRAGSAADTWIDEMVKHESCDPDAFASSRRFIAPLLSLPYRDFMIDFYIIVETPLPRNIASRCRADVGGVRFILEMLDSLMRLEE